MTTEEYVKQSRKEQAERFGAIGLKTDCKYYGSGKNGCQICSLVRDSYHSKCVLPCEQGVCYFYKERGAV